MIEAKIFNLAITDKGFVVMLKPVRSDKVIPITITVLEAQSIMLSFIGYKIERPLTHDIINSMFKEFNIRLLYVIIDNIRSDVYHAKLVMERDGKNTSIDSRPSDAIALALKSGVSIFVENKVIEKAGMILEESGAVVSENKGGTPFEYPIFDIEKGNLKEDNNRFTRNRDSDKEIKSGKTREELQKRLEEAIKEERYEDAERYKEELNNFGDV